MQQEGCRMSVNIPGSFYIRIDDLGELIFNCSKTGSDKFFGVQLKSSKSNNLKF